MADTSIAIAPAIAPAAAPVQIKTISVIDSNGNVVQIQAVVLVDEFGDPFQAPMSNAMGAQILGMLINIHNVLSEAYGVSLQLPSYSASGNKE